MREFRVIVCGGRDYWQPGDMNRVMGELNDSPRGPIYAVIHGNARGADSLAGAWAKRNGVREWPVPAEWSKFGNSAGPRRNKQMLGMGASLVVAFPGGRGTKNMVKQARAAGLEVLEVEDTEIHPSGHSKGAM